VVTANTEAVPATSTPTPSCAAPQAKKLATVSPQPATSGTPGRRPHLRAMPAVSSPTISSGRTIRGSLDRSTPKVRQSSSSHRPCTLSAKPEKCRYVRSRNARDASSPHKRMAAYAPGCTNAAMSRYADLRSCIHQRILGPWLKLGGPPVWATIRRPATASIRLMCAAQRVSSQESYGVTWRPSRPTPRIPAIWPSMPMPATSAARTAAWRTLRLIAAQAEATWRSGSSSTTPGDGRCSFEGTKAWARHSPSSLNKAALVPWVPISTPMSAFIPSPHSFLTNGRVACERRVNCGLPAARPP